MRFVAGAYLKPWCTLFDPLGLPVPLVEWLDTETKEFGHLTEGPDGQIVRTPWVKRSDGSLYRESVITVASAVGYSYRVGNDGPLTKIE